MKALDVLRASGSDSGKNLALALFFLIVLFVNIVGEEFWWRGLILPRQELAHGKTTWLIHGTMWTLFHAFKYWHWILLFPVCMILAFVAQRRRNTWPGIITHFMVNGISSIPIFIALLGN